jgi:hypothetical protein
MATSHPIRKIRKVENLNGQRFGHWVVISPERFNLRCKCRCDCGTIDLVFPGNLKSGTSISCGCIRNHGVRPTLHGLSKTPTYRIWKAMKQRCYRPAAINYADYGGRGIIVCDRWLHSYENFLADMGSRPTPKHSIERNDNEGNYEPSNCRWATVLEQRRNKRNSRWLTFNGETRCVTEWAEITGIDRHNIERRLGLGWPVKAILTVKPKIGQRIIENLHKPSLADSADAPHRPH